MSDFLTAVSSVRAQKENQDSASLLTAVKSTDTRAQKANITLEERRNGDLPQTNDRDEPAKAMSEPGSPEEALQILRSQPDQGHLIPILKQLRSNGFNNGDFSLHTSGPLQAQILNTIVSTIVPDFWSVLSVKDRGNLVACLHNVAGFNAVTARLRLLATQSSSKKDGSVDSHTIEDLLQVSHALFSGESNVFELWQGLQSAVSDKVKRELSWKEFIKLIGSGKVVSTVAQAEEVVRVDSNKASRKSWLSNGGQYTAWLGRNIANMTISRLKHLVSIGKSQDSAAAAAQLLAKALNLGYPGHLLKGLFSIIVEGDNRGEDIRTLLERLPSHAKRSLVEHTLRWLSSIVRPTRIFDLSDIQKQGEDVAAVAALTSTIASSDIAIQQHIVSFLTDPGLSSSLSLPVRRACLFTLADSCDDDDLSPLLEKLMSTFSNQLFISHAPILQQEDLAQMILITTGYVHRKNTMALLMTARSSNHLQGVSSRLDSSNLRARWLGMVVATAISRLVDKEGAKMEFGTEDLQTEEARWYVELVTVEDHVGSLAEFNTLLSAQDKTIKSPKRTSQHKDFTELPKLKGKPVFGPPRPPVLVQTEVIGEKVTELLDSDSDHDGGDLKPYAKPDSDPEDSDEDATLVNRNKARAPVYIRDLMAMLRDDKNHDRFQLGIRHGAALVRRKANFGKEVKDHAEELASILCNLQDPFETENFDSFRLQVLIAVLLSDVNTLAPWLSRQAFTGDYSISQRCIVLSALGLGGRELAGFKNEDEELNPATSNTDFPSKRLPSRLHSVYSSANDSAKRLEAASREIEHALIKPMALQVADQSTAHLNAVKVRTFSSRMEVERTKRKLAPNQLAKVFSSAFFFPLANSYQREVSAYGAASVYASTPFLLVTFLKTLALLLHASGPATMVLPQLTAEFWDLLLSLRVHAVQDISVLQAVLFALLTLLEVNTDKRRIADEHAKQLMETQTWVNMVFERMSGSSGGLVSESGSDAGEEEKVKTLAAGVLVKTREIVEAYQKQLLGSGYSLD